jgi:hypothetical protein
VPHWFIKAALQRGISWLPHRQKWNELFQRHVTHSLDLSADRFEGRVGFCRWYLEQFRKIRPDRMHDFHAVEVGTGWYPVVPLGLYLHGAKNVWTFDIDALVNRTRLETTVRMLLDYASRGQLQKLWPDLLPERLEVLRALRAMNSGPDVARQLGSLGIYLRVQDASRTDLPVSSVDLMVSTGVLEYIPLAVLKAILIEFKRIGTPGAVMAHYINLIDQYSYFDRSLSPLNFLRFPESKWKYFNSPLTWLNRLRISDYREMFRAADFKIVAEENERGAEADLDRVPLAPEFQKYSREDLLVFFSRIAARSASD